MLIRLQREHKPWAAHNFGADRPAWQPLLGAVEEIGELAHAHLKHAQGIRNAENHIENAKDAIGDIIIYLADYCNLCGYDLDEIVFETWETVKRRDWQKDPDGAHVGNGDTVFDDCRDCHSFKSSDQWPNICPSCGKDHGRPKE